jgi:hypothetical protein
MTITKASFKQDLVDDGTIYYRLSKAIGGELGDVTAIVEIDGAKCYTVLFAVYGSETNGIPESYLNISESDDLLG